MINYSLMLILIFCAAIGNILLKLILNRTSFPEIASLSNLFQSMFILFKTPLMWLVFIIYLPSLLIYFYLLKKLEISYFSPILTSAVFILVLLFSWVFLDEQVTMMRVMGVMFIILGVFLVAKS